MADDGVSMSLDDYIKSKKKGGPGGGKRGGRGGGKPSAKGKGPQQQGSKGNFRYFNPGSGGGRGGNQTARAGKSRGGGQAQRSRGGGAKNRNFNARNARTSVQGAKRGAVQQQQRGRNRVTRGARNRPTASQAGSRRNRSQELSPRRTPIKGVRSNRGRRNERIEVIGRNRLNTPAVRGRSRARGAGARGVGGRNRPLAVRKPVNPTKAAGRLQTRTVQKLVQKRIQRARLTLSKKTSARPLRGLMSSRPRLQTARGGALRVRAALAEQKLGRARQARGRAQNQSRTRGLLLDRTQSVRIRVRNDQAVPAGTYTGYRPDPGSLVGYNPMYPSQDYYGGDSFQFPPMVLNNASSSRSPPPPPHAPFQEVLNPDIQKKIAMIQERGKPAEAEVSPDFRYVSASRVKLGDRFRSLMK